MPKRSIPGLRTARSFLASLALAGLLVGCGLLAGCENSQAPSPDKSVFQPAFSSTAAEVMDFIAKGQGGAKAKLAFVDRTKAAEELCFIDFSEAGAPVIRRIPAARMPEVPVISPDGNWVVYASGSGTEAGSPLTTRSSVYISRLSADAVPQLVAGDSACEPRFVQNIAGALSIVYTTKAPNFGWEGFGRTVQIDVDVSGAAPVVGASKTLVEGGSYTGGLSWDTRFLVGGGGHVAMLDMIGAKGRPDTLSYDLIQSCNASISSSRAFTNTTMYLNTGSSSPLIDGGKPFGEWQAILISNGAKQLVRGYSYPKDPVFPLETEPKSFSRAKWHHCEWSNHPYFATATLNVDRYFKNGADYANTLFQERIYLLNLKDSSYLEVLRPDKVAFGGKNVDVSGFYWPWLWVEVPTGFKESEDWLKPAP